MVSQGTYVIPDCICGYGKMQVKCTGPKSNHMGRYYYKCPTNDVICGRLNDLVGNIPDYVLNQTYKPKTSHLEQSATSTYRGPARA